MIDILLITVAMATGVQQAPPPPPPPMMAPRDPSTVKKGKFVIRGRITTADGRPLRRAQIRAVAGDSREAVTTTTGLDGEYELIELPAGRYTIDVTRSGYLRVQYGAASFGEPGTPVVVGEAATVEKIDVVLSRAGVVSGRVTDETGDPAAGVDIRAMQWQYFQGRKRMVPVATWPVHVESDDTGHYRLPGLPPGEYFISGRLRDTWTTDEKEPRMLSYAPTYYPGTAEVSEARRISIVAGQEAGAIDFTLIPVSAARLSGVALAADGTPLASARVILTQQIMGPSGGTMGFAGNAVTDTDGRWRIEDVAPGEYVARVTGSVGDGPSETGILPITVQGMDLDGLVIAADPGATISGRVVTESGEPLPGGSSSRTTVTTRPVSLVTGTVRPVPGTNDGVVGADGSFRRIGPSGPVVIAVSGLPRGWALKHISIDGRDHAGLPVDLPKGGAVSNITLVLSNALPSLAGRVTNAEGDPARSTVLLFPADDSRWIEAAANQRSVRADASGSYRFDDVRPGEYFIMALTSMQSWQMNDPEFLGEQRKRATKVAIGGDAVTVDLKEAK